MGPPLLLVIIIAAVYAHYGDAPALRRALTGVASAAGAGATGEAVSSGGSAAAAGGSAGS